jgi:uncharacterized C2H2 Zn-finger protein
LLFTPKSITEVVKFCLDIDYNVRDHEILPKSVCQSCIDKLQIAFELKNKGIESEKYLNEILMSNCDEIDAEEPEMIPYNPASYYDGVDDQDDLLEESYVQPDDDEQNVSNDTARRRGEKTGDFACNICGKTFRYTKSYKNHLRTHQAEMANKNGAEEQPVIMPFDDDENDEESNESEFELPQKGEKTGEFDCQVCNKTFRYIKAYKNHLKQHKIGLITNGGHRRRNRSKQASTAGPSSPTKQAPYDSRSPYESPAPYALSPVQRDSSPDFGTMMVTSDFINGDSSPPKKRQRLYKPAPLSRSPSRDPPQEEDDDQLLLETDDLTSSSRPSRGRPRKTPHIPKVDENIEKYKPSTSAGPKSRGRPRKFAREETSTSVSENKQNEEEEEEEEEQSVLADFQEVDLSRVLKSKSSFSIWNDESESQSAPSTRSRSRSPSLEIVQEFDIFGSVLPDNGSTSNANKKPTSSFGNGTTFPCTIGGCGKKFHLRANLKKHLRETHGKD